MCSLLCTLTPAICLHIRAFVHFDPCHVVTYILLCTLTPAMCLCMYVCLHTHRETAVKFNDYFEFPRELNMAPYTAAKLAKLEGTSIHVYNNVHVYIRMYIHVCNMYNLHHV